MKHDDLYTFMITSRWIKCFRKNFRKNQKTHFIFTKVSSDNLTVYEVISKNVVQPACALRAG